jgi:hypothetical protein
MLRKVLKYDIKSVWRYWWIAAVIFVAATLICSVGLRAYIEYMDWYGRLPFEHSVTYDLITIFSSMSLFVVVIGEYLLMAGFALMPSLLTAIRYYKNFFSDNGYLTFTLPVKRSTHLMSKIINGMLWNAVTVMLTFVGVGIMLLIIPPTYGDGLINPVVYRDFFEGLGIIFKESPIWFIVYCFIGIITFVVVTFFSAVIIPLCITIGSTIAKKHKILASIGIYYGFSFITSIGSEIMYFMTILMTTGLSTMVYGATSDQMLTLIAAFILLLTAMGATMGIIAYNINLNIIERKLNLA